MTYRQEMTKFAATMADLIRDGGRVHGDDLRAAVSGHAALVSLLKTLHGDVSGVRVVRAVRDQGTEIERHPVAELKRWLDRQPWGTDQAATSIMPSTPTDLAGRRWQDLARTAARAQWEWQHAAAGSTPTGDAAWAEMADIARMCEGLAYLNGDIADSMSAVARVQDAAEFRAASRSGLGLVAREVVALAQTGPLTGSSNPSPSVLVSRASQPPDFATFLQELREAVAGAKSFGPAQLAAAAVATADVVALATRSAKDAGLTAAVKELESQHRRLMLVGRGVGEIAVSVMPDTGPGSNIRLIRHLTSQLRTQSPVLAPDAIAAVAAVIPSLTKQLLESSERQLAGGAWRVQQSGVEEPRIIGTLRRAAEQAPAIVRALPAVGKEVVPGPPPREVVGQALARRKAPPRPATPGTPRYAMPYPAGRRR